MNVQHLARVLITSRSPLLSTSRERSNLVEKINKSDVTVRSLPCHICKRPPIVTFAPSRPGYTTGHWWVRTSSFDPRISSAFCAHQRTCWEQRDEAQMTDSIIHASHCQYSALLPLFLRGLTRRSSGYMLSTTTFSSVRIL